MDSFFKEDAPALRRSWPIGVFGRVFGSVLCGAWQCADPVTRVTDETRQVRRHTDMHPVLLRIQ